MGLDDGGLLVGAGLLLGLAELLDEAHRARLESALEATAGTGVDELDERLVVEVEESVELDTAVGVLLEGTGRLLGGSLLTGSKLSLALVPSTESMPTQQEGGRARRQHGDSKQTVRQEGSQPSTQSRDLHPHAIFPPFRPSHSSTHHDAIGRSERVDVRVASSASRVSHRRKTMSAVVPRSVPDVRTSFDREHGRFDALAKEGVAAGREGSSGGNLAHFWPRHLCPGVWLSAL